MRTYQPSRLFAIVCLTVASLFATGMAHAQTYPSKPIRLIVPFEPGGASDVVGRLVAQALGQKLGQSIIVENRPGANGNIGADMVAKAPPDGYTLLLGFEATIVINPSAYPDLPFNPIKDFAPIINIGSIAPILLANPSFPASNTKELIAYAKQHPGLTYTTPGYGSTPHLIMLRFAQLTGTKFTHVPYNGGPQGITDVVGGHVPLGWGTVAGVRGQIKGGTVKVLATSSATRLASLPNVGTFEEAGLTGFNVTGWYGLLAPAGTPKPVIDRLNHEMSVILATPEMKDRFLTMLGGDVIGGTPEQFAATIKSDTTFWANIVKENGISLK